MRHAFARGDRKWVAKRNIEAHIKHRQRFYKYQRNDITIDIVLYEEFAVNSFYYSTEYRFLNASFFLSLSLISCNIFSQYSAHSFVSVTYYRCTTTRKRKTLMEKNYIKREIVWCFFFCFFILVFVSLDIFNAISYYVNLECTCQML